MKFWSNGAGISLNIHETETPDKLDEVQLSLVLDFSSRINVSIHPPMPNQHQHSSD